MLEDGLYLARNEVRGSLMGLRPWKWWEWKCHNESVEVECLESSPIFFLFFIGPEMVVVTLIIACLMN